jgi:hypothetical protein
MRRIRGTTAGTLAIAVLTIVVWGAITPAAEAAPFRLRVESLATGAGVVVTDEGTGDGAPGAVGLISLVGSFAGTTISVTSGLSQPMPPPPGAASFIDLTHIAIVSTGAISLRVSLEDLGFDDVPAGLHTFSSSVGGVLSAAPGSTATFRSWVNNLNDVIDYGADTFPEAVLPALGTVPAGSSVLIHSTFGPGAFAETLSRTFTSTAAYSLFTQANITFSGPGSVSFDLVATVPEPGTLALLGGGLLVAFARRRRRA